MEKEQIKKNATKHIERIFETQARDEGTDTFSGDIVVDITDGEVYVTEGGWGSTTANQNNGECIWSICTMAHDGLDKNEFTEIVMDYIDEMTDEDEDDDYPPGMYPSFPV